MVPGFGRLPSDMARTQITGGTRDGDWITCKCIGECECEMFGHGAPGGNKIMDGYVEYLMYRKENGCWVPDRIERQTMVCEGSCPRCQRPMPKGIVYCRNCGAEMNPSAEWEDERLDEPS